MTFPSVSLRMIGAWGALRALDHSLFSLMAMRGIRWARDQVPVWCAWESYILPLCPFGQPRAGPGFPIAMEFSLTSVLRCLFPATSEDETCISQNTRQK